MIKIENYNDVKVRLSFYGGNAGTKKGFYKKNGEKWFMKFPKITKNFKNVEISYTTSVLSEYLGSQIYKSIGLPVHETELGIYGDKLVVACKDFNLEKVKFNEMKLLFNENLGEKERIRESLISNTESTYNTDIEELNYVLNNNEHLKDNIEIKNRFWDMFIVDCLINNNDRHNGNWGVFVSEEENTVSLAPIYDNGNSFFPKHDEEKLKNIENIKQLVSNGRTPYIFKNKNIDSVKVIKNLSLRDNNLNFGDNREEKFLKEISDNIQAALIRVVPKINLEKINKIIDEIPEEHNGIKVMSKPMRNFYKIFLKNRYEIVLLPALEKCKEIEKTKNVEEIKKSRMRSRARATNRGDER